MSEFADGFVQVVRQAEAHLDEVREAFHGDAYADVNALVDEAEAALFGFQKAYNQILRAIAQHEVTMGSFSPEQRVLTMGSFSPEQRVLVRCAAIAQRLGHRIPGLREALISRGDVTASRALLDRYLEQQHKLPATSASWEKLAAEWSNATTLEFVRFLQEDLEREDFASAIRLTEGLLENLRTRDPATSPDARLPGVSIGPAREQNRPQVGHPYR